MGGKHVSGHCRRFGTSQSTDRTPWTPTGLALVMGLVAAGLLIFAGAANAAPEDPPDVEVASGLDMAPGQEIIIHARNVNNDLSNTWTIDVNPDVDGDTTTSDDRNATWRWAMPSDFSGTVDVTFTVTDGLGDSDSETTTISSSSNPTLEQLDPIDLDSGTPVAEPTEDTDIRLRVEGPTSLVRTTIYKNFPNQPMTGSEDSPGIWGADTNYLHPGIHIVGYEVEGAAGNVVTLIDEVNILEEAPEVSLPIDRFDVREGQRVSFVATATDGDNEDVTFSIAWVNTDEVTDTKLVQDGNEARFWGTFTDDHDGATLVTIQAEDVNGGVGEADIIFDIGPNPDVDVTSTDETLEDQDVTLSATIDSSDLSYSSVKIWKNFEWEDALLMDTFESTDVGMDTWEATFNYGVPAVHYPGYQVLLASGDAITIMEPLDVLEAPPEINAPDQIRAVDNTKIFIDFTATDSDGEAITSWALSSTPSISANFQSSGDTARLIWNIPQGFDASSVDLTFEATDELGATGSSTTTIELDHTSDVHPHLPKEVDTGVVTRFPVTGETLRFKLDAQNPDGGIDSVDVLPEGLDGPTLAASFDGGNTYTNVGYAYAEAGVQSVAYRITDSDGAVHGTFQDIQVMENAPPEVDAGQDIQVDPGTSGQAVISLRGSASDPEMRSLDDADFEWTTPGGDVLVGANQDGISLPIGLHTFELRVTDMYGAVGMDTMNVAVDDYILASGSLDSTQGQSGDVAILNPTAHLGDRIDGRVNVVDDLGDPVEGAVVSGVVKYFGTAANGLALAETPIDTTTPSDASGVATFSFDQDFVDPISGDSMASATGYHVVEITITGPSRAGAPVDDVETTETRIKYWVGPGDPVLS